MDRWSVVRKLVSSVSQWKTATSSVPRSSSVRIVSWLASVTSSSSSSSLSNSPLENAKRTTMSDVHKVTRRPQSNLNIAIERGAYDERTIPHVTGYNVKNLAVVENGKHLEITWENGKVSRYHSLWLRHTCFCSDCKFDGNGQPKMAYDQIPSDLMLSSATDDGEGCLVVQWKNEDGHTGVFPLKFLKFHCYSPESLKELRESIRMTFTTDTTIQEVTYEEVMESDKGLLKWMTILSDRGICMVKGLPAEPGMGRKVCERISRSIMPTVYGFVDDVKSNPVPINAGYSTDELKLHQDLTYYSCPPGLQVLFCLKFDPNIKGGESIFADMFHLAETFRERHPEDFNVLATVPATLDTIHYQRAFPVHMNAKRPMFVLNDHGDLVGVRYQPHHLGPLQVSEFRVRLHPGDMVSYNNRRMAHGRTAYSYQSGQERHLQGCYINVSELKSCMQILSNLIGDRHLVKRIGDCDYM